MDSSHLVQGLYIIRVGSERFLILRGVLGGRDLEPNLWANLKTRDKVFKSLNMGRIGLTRSINEHLYR